MTRKDRPAESAAFNGHGGQNTIPSQRDVDRATLKEQLATLSLMLEASPTALIALDKAGLIVHVNPSAMDLLGAEKSYLLKKPVSLFIAPEDQATFYINRSRIAGGAQCPPIEIKLRKKDGAFFSARVKAKAIETPGAPLPGMLLAIDDITAYRQALERLQFKEDLAHLLFSTLADLASWPAADIDDIVGYALEKMGIVSGADRVYVCLFHDKKTRLSITHEWIGEGIEPPSLKNTPVGAFVQVVKKIGNQATANIADVDALPPTERSSHAGFHAAGVKSVLLMPLAYGRRLLGIIGCDAVRQPMHWSEDIQQLVKCIGSAIVQALVRRQTERGSDTIRRAILQLVEPASPAAGDGVLEYDGPIEVVDETAPAAAPADIDWHIVEEIPDDSGLVDTIFLKNGKTASLACNNCYRQRQLDISEIRVIGTQLKATCACGNVKYIKVELRREHRKAVNLRGVFMRGPGDRLALKSDDWGHIEIHNLSRRGIGFELLGNADIRIKDRFRVKFTLDNTAQSIIQKKVVVRSIADKMIGCQFEGQDACDVTLGFYMMS